jgi:GNAT superfamily N-acetyltransferase
MSKSTPETATAKTSPLMFRLDAESKQALAEAAALRRISLSDYVRAVPVAVLAWLGVSQAHQSRKLGDLLLAQALRDCFGAGQTFALVAVILDCLNDRAKTFYKRWDFEELPGNPYRLSLGAQTLAAMMEHS